MADKNIKKPKINEPDTNIPGRLGTEPTTPNLSQIGIPPVEATRVVPNTPNSVPDATVPSHSEAASTAPNVSQMGIPPVEATRVVPSTPNSIPDANIPGHSAAEPTTPNVLQMDMPPVEASRVIPPKAQNSVPDANIPGHSVAEPTTPNVSQMGVPAPTTPVADSTPTNTTPVADSTNAGAQQSGTDVGNNPFADRAAVQDAIAQQTSNPSTVQQPVVPTEEKPEVKDAPQYLTDWSKVGNVYEEAKKLNLPLAQVLQDYQRWGNETGNPTYWINAMFQDADLSKSVADNEEAKKMQERKERWDKVNNFLMHLGNAIGNVASGNYGSVKLEDPVQWTERQRLLKEKGLEQRRLNNQSLIQQMHKNWADARAFKLKLQQQDRLDKETKIRQEKNDAYIQAQRAAASKNEAQTAYWEAKANALEQGYPLDEAIKKANLAKIETETRLNNVKANNGGFAPQRPVQQRETTTTKTDSHGRRTTTTTVTGPVGSTAGAGKNKGGKAFGNRGKGRSAFGSRK